MSLVNVLGKFGSTVVSKSVFTSTPAKYALTVSPNSSSVNIGGIDYPAVNEGTTVTFVLVPNKVNKFNYGAVVPYNITGIETADLVNGNLTGQFIVGTDMVRTFTIDEDANDDSINEIMTMSVVNPAPTNAVGLSASVYIADSSKAPPSYTLYLSGNGSTTGFVYEDIGTTVTFALKTRGVYHGTQIPYTITGIDINDLDTGSASLQGYFTVSSIITAGWLNDKEFPNPLPEDITYVTFNIKKDGIIEGNETMVITLSSHVDPVRGILTATEGRTAQVIIKDEMPEVLSNEVVLFVKGEGPNDSQNNTFLDSSTNNFAITRVGTTTQGSFSPHALNGSAYNPSVHGGSGYFDGTTDYLDCGAAILNTTGNFTIECWIYVTGKSGTFRNIIGQYINGNANRTSFAVDENNKLTWTTVGSITELLSLNPISENIWTHVCIVRNGSGSNNTSMYINGIVQGSYTDTTNFAQTNTWIGQGQGYSNGLFVGYISNLRITTTAIYTSNFALPTSPLTLTSNGGATPSTAPTSGQVSLLCNFTNGGIIDSTAKNDLTTVGNAKVSTSVVKYGTGSIAFDGSSYLTVPQNNLMSLGTQPFTLEGWFYANSYPSDGLYTALMSLGRGAFSNTISSGWALVVGLNSIAFGRWANGSVQIYPVSMVMPVKSWQHYAVVRDSSNNLSIFLNGNIILNTTSTLAFDNVNSDPLCIGIWRSGSTNVNRFFDGYMDDLRITKGVAVYTSNFTPPLT